MNSPQFISRVRRTALQRTLGATLCLSSLTAAAHEYWLDPIYSSVTAGDNVIIDVRNGQNFSGSAFPFDSDKFKTVSIHSATDKVDYLGRLGDYPALHPRLESPGLYLLNVDTQVNTLVYDSWQQFKEFLNYHGLDGIAEQHQQRALPKNDITEHYYRSAKTLVMASAPGEKTETRQAVLNIENHHAFMPVGSELELQLLNNPYSDDATVTLKLLYKGKALANRQTEMFWRGSTLIRVTTKTNELGVAEFKLLGDGDYLINAVHVVEPSNTDAHWLSHWASFTFER